MSAERAMEDVVSRATAREFLASRNVGIPEQILRLMCDGSSGDSEFEEGMVKAFLECFELAKTRHRKYGRGNIAQYADAGCLVRDSDKSARLQRRYFESVVEDFDDESVLDAWRDKVNYSIFGLMCFTGTFPGVLSNERAPEPA